MTIDEAFKAIREILPRDQCSVAIEVQVWEHTQLDHRKVEFRIWDGNQSHTAPSLEAAVQLFLIEHTTNPNAMQEAEAVAVEVSAEVDDYQAIDRVARDRLIRCTCGDDGKLVSIDCPVPAHHKDALEIQAREDLPW